MNTPLKRIDYINANNCIEEYMAIVKPKADRIYNQLCGYHLTTMYWVEEAETLIHKNEKLARRILDKHQDTLNFVNSL